MQEMKNISKDLQCQNKGNCQNRTFQNKNKYTFSDQSLRKMYLPYANKGRD